MDILSLKTEGNRTAVFVKMPLREKAWDMLVWTATPWTLTANVALAVNPHFEYCAVKTEGHEQPLVLAKKALKLIHVPVEVLSTMSGKDLTGLHYEACFPHLHLRENPEHKVIAWDKVVVEEGSGVASVAPGCSVGDYELGCRLGLSTINPFDKTGAFSYGYGELTGVKALEAVPMIVSKLKERGKLFAINP